MTELYEFKNIKKTRKGHVCELCLRKIPKGFSARRHKGKSEDRFFTYYTCNTCTKLLNGWQELFVDDELCLQPDYLNDLMSDYEYHSPYQLLRRLADEGTDN